MIDMLSTDSAIIVIKTTYHRLYDKYYDEWNGSKPKIGVELDV